MPKLHRLLIKCNNIKKKYSSNVIFDDVSIELSNTEIVGIFGKSGSGKTTLISIIGLLDSDFEGTYLFDDVDVTSVDDKLLANIRKNKIGFIFQNNILIENLLVYENILHNFKVDEVSEYHEQMIALSKELNIYELLNRVTYSLSDGEKQRVNILRAILRDPDLIIADEPTSNLDKYNKKIVLDFIEQTSKKNKCIIIVSHDDSIKKVCNKIINLDDEVIEVKPCV